MPRASLASLDLPLLQSAPSISLHSLSGHWAWQAALFALTGLFAIGLGVGWRTRAMTIASWALLTSLHAHNPVVLHRGDAVLRLMLFFSMWLPLGARFSLDARRRGAPRHVEVQGAACLAVTAQVMLVYLVSVLHKSGPTWREEGTAVYYALQLDDYATPLGRWIGARPAWSPALTWGTLALEVLAPLLLVVTWRREHARWLAVAAGFAVHIGLLLTMYLDLFTWIMFACWVVFLPPSFWEWVLRPSASPRGPAGLAHSAHWRWPVAGAVAAIAAWNAGDLAGSRPEALGPIMRATGLAQRWSMFSPDPARDDGWLVASARREDGSTVDALDDKARGVDGAEGRPARRDLRWRTYFAEVARDRRQMLQPSLLAWLCRRAPPDTIDVTLVFEKEYTMPPGELPVRESVTLSSASCRAPLP